MAAAVGRGGTTVANGSTFLDLPSATLRFSGVQEFGVGVLTPFGRGGY